MAPPGAWQWLERLRSCDPEGRMSRGQGCGTQKEPQRLLGMPQQQGETLWELGELGREDMEEEGEGSFP